MKSFWHRTMDFEITPERARTIEALWTIAKFCVKGAVIAGAVWVVMSI